MRLRVWVGWRVGRRGGVRGMRELWGGGMWNVGVWWGKKWVYVLGG